MKLGSLLRELCLGRVEFEMPTVDIQAEMSRQQMDLQVWRLAEKSGLEKHIWRFFSTWIAFKAMREDEIAKEAWEDREDGKVWALSSGLWDDPAKKSKHKWPVREKGSVQEQHEESILRREQSRISNTADKLVRRANIVQHCIHPEVLMVRTRTVSGVRWEQKPDGNGITWKMERGLGHSWTNHYRIFW